MTYLPYLGTVTCLGRKDFYLPSIPYLWSESTSEPMSMEALECHGVGAGMDILPDLHSMHNAITFVSLVITFHIAKPQCDGLTK